MIVVDIRLDHPLLREAVTRVPGIEVEIERDDESADERELLFWATGGDVEAFEAALAGDPTVEVTRSAGVGDRTLYKATMTGAGASTALYPVLVDTGTLIESATISAEGMDCRLGFPDRDAVDRFVETCRDHDIPFEVTRVLPGGASQPSAESDADGLTAKQREALLEAHRLGYFDVPRSVDLISLGESLGISDAAASQRLRRGIATLIEAHVEAPPDPDPDPDSVPAC